MTDKMRRFVTALIADRCSKARIGPGLSPAVCLLAKKAKDQYLDIQTLYAAFRPTTAVLGLGEDNTISEDGAAAYPVGYSGQRIYYRGGHLIVEDQQ